MQCFATRWPRCRNSFRPLSDVGWGFAPQISQKIAAGGGPALSQSTTNASATYGVFIGLLSSATRALRARVIRMISGMAANPIVRLLYLRIAVTLLLLRFASQFHFRRNDSALFGN
jgi:hypothetical protein